MKILTIHSDHLTVEVKKKAIKEAEEIKENKQEFKDCLVIFTAVEKEDESNAEQAAKLLEEEVKKIAEQIKEKNIVLYPYAHLSPNLSSPEKAVEILKKAEELLKKEKFNVARAPFGYYKAFSINTKGHPLSELSRSFSPSEKAEKKDEVSEAVKKEEKLKSKFYIITTDGKLHEITKDKNDIKGFDFSKYEGLKKYCMYEMAKSREVNEEPPHIKYMRKLELVDHEPGSDPGNLRYYPKGRFIKKQLETLTTNETLKYGAMEIEAPIMYDYEHPSLKSYLNRFPARQYTIQTPNKKVFLRFAACFGQFLMAHDTQISYKQLPIKLYEMTKYSFRVEQRGELAGLRRLRAFTMPDCHAFCRDEQQAIEEFMKRIELCWTVQEKVGISPQKDLEFAARITKEFYEKNKDFLLKVVKRIGKPMMLEMWDEKIFYFIFKMEWNFVDSLGKAACLSTDQIDVENGSRYGIVFTDADGKKKNPLILHCSPSGAIERVMWALLEKAYLDEKQEKVPSLPLWLSPTQVRIIPVSIEKHGTSAEKLAKKFEREDIRVDIDDRVETIGKRIRDAEQEWIPYMIVWGDKEQETKKITVRIRGKKDQEETSFEKLSKQIKEETKEKPTNPLPLPKYISKRPIFVG